MYYTVFVESVPVECGVPVIFVVGSRDLKRTLDLDDLAAERYIDGVCPAECVHGRGQLPSYTGPRLRSLEVSGRAGLRLRCLEMSSFLLGVGLVDCFSNLSPDATAQAPRAR